MAVGNAGGTGDGIMVVADVEALAYEYCGDGVAVQLAVETTTRRRPCRCPCRPSRRFLDAEGFASGPGRGDGRQETGVAVEPFP